MSTTELRKRLIEKIELTTDNQLLEEASRLLEIGVDDFEVYHLNDEQQKAIEEARRQVKNRAFLTDQDSNKEIDEWLGK